MPKYIFLFHLQYAYLSTFLYLNCDFRFFREAADTLQTYEEQILNSFIMIHHIDHDGILHESRLSNGPVESLNRVPKDMKRIGRRYLNFEHIRNRFLFSQRKNAAILATQKTLDFLDVYREEMEEQDLVISMDLKERRRYPPDHYGVDIDSFI